MKVYQNITIDLAKNEGVAYADASQGDSARFLRLILEENGAAWNIPEGVVAAVRYRKPDGTGGTYDTLPDGTPAGAVRGNILQLGLAPQVCSVAGKVHLQIVFMKHNSQVSSFAMVLNVEESVGFDEKSEEYMNLSAWLQQNRGKDGKDGENGANGKDGKDGYTPVKGVDYFTPDDREKLIREVKAGMDSEYAPRIVRTVEGAVVSVSDSMNRPFKNYMAYILAEQDGSGEASVSNVRAIRGVDAIDLTLCGKNLLPASATTPVANATIQYRPVLYIEDFTYLAGITYTISFDTENTGKAVYLNSAGGDFGWHTFTMDGKRHSFTKTFTSNQTIRHQAIVSVNETTDVEVGLVSNVQIEIGGAATGYEAYHAKVYHIPLPQMMYGGYADYAGKKFVQTHGYIPGYAGEEISGAFISSTGALNPGSQIVYELEQAVEHDFALMPEISPVSAVTNIFTSGEKLAVTYEADTKQYIDSKFKELSIAMLALGG